MKHGDIVRAMSLEDKVAFCSGFDYVSTKALEKYGIPSILMIDGPHGLRKPYGSTAMNVGNATLPATCFPTASAAACSWDRELARLTGEAFARECLHFGASVQLGPGINIHRSPLCGRNFEYFSEDPYLAGELAASRVRGQQGLGVGVSLKHFACNSQESFRMASDSLVDERALREIYLSAFEKIVREARPATVMTAYNKVNGSYCSDHGYLVGKLLRGEWGYEGVVVSDWGGLHDRVAAFKAGLDLEMPGGLDFYDAEAIEAVRRGELDEARIDESVDRLLDLVLRSHNAPKEDAACDFAAHHELARRVARESAVLLKNEGGILPLAAGAKVALIGPMARAAHFQGFGSSRAVPTEVSSVEDGFRTLGLAYEYAQGYRPGGRRSGRMLAKAAQAAKSCEVAVLVLGLDGDALEGEGYDRPGLELPAAQVELLERVASVNANTVVLLVAGSPVEMPWLPLAKAVLDLGLAGQAAGLAAADLLSGRANPSGKLATTFPLRYSDVPCAGYWETGGRQAQYRESIYVGYRYYDKARAQVLFPFGHGLSYTSFAYRDLELSSASIAAGEGLSVSLTVQNSGSRDGAEVVQLYVGELAEGIFRPLRELAGFEKVLLAAGEEKRVSMRLEGRAFSYFDVEEGAWIAPSGRYAISVGSSSRDLRLSAELELRGSPRKIAPSGLSPWYLAPSGHPSQADFESLLGRPVQTPPEPRKGSYTLEHSIADMEASRLMRVAAKAIAAILELGHLPKPKANPHYKMMIAGALTSPLKNLAAMSPQMPRGLAEGLVAMANGRFLRRQGRAMGLRSKG